jgi:hypothetical protein
MIREKINGNARVIDEDTINITLSKNDLHKIRTNKDGEFYQFHIKRSLKPDRFGNTHVIQDGHCKERPKVLDPVRKLKDNWCDEPIPPYADNKGKSTLDLF